MVDVQQYFAKLMETRQSGNHQNFVDQFLELPNEERVRFMGWLADTVYKEVGQPAALAYSTLKKCLLLIY